MVYYMTKDHFAYVGAYRKCIDEIEQLKKRDVEYSDGFKDSKRTRI